MARPALRPAPPPLETDDVRTVAVGMVLWALAGLLLLAFARGALAHHHASWWLAVPPTGVALGVLGIGYCRRRQRHRDNPR